MTPGADRHRGFRRSAALALILLAFLPLMLSWWSGGIVATLLSGSLDAEAKIRALRTFVLSAGPAAPLVYVLAVVIEVVVAPLPGLMLYAPGGAIFGGFVGGMLSLAGNIIGAAVAFFIARALGGDWLRDRLGEGRLAAFESRLGRHGLAVVFLLRVNPLTSSDLVSYAAGLTSMPAWKLIAGTAVGMAPLSFAQSYAAAGLVNRYPWLIYGLALLAVGYLVAIAVVVGRSRNAPTKSRRPVSARADR